MLKSCLKICNRLPKIKTADTSEKACKIMNFTADKQKYVSLGIYRVTESCN